VVRMGSGFDHLTLRFRRTATSSISISRSRSAKSSAGRGALTTWSGPVEWQRITSVSWAPSPARGAAEPGAFCHIAQCCPMISTSQGRRMGRLRKLHLTRRSLGQAGTYLVALCPRAPEFGPSRRRRRPPVWARTDRSTSEVGLVASIPPLAPRQAWKGSFLSYIGPMEFERLKALRRSVWRNRFILEDPDPESKARDWGCRPSRWSG